LKVLKRENLLEKKIASEPLLSIFHMWKVKHDLSEKKFRLSRAVAVERKICATPSPDHKT
jgi:hypothetical protein